MIADTLQPSGAYPVFAGGTIRFARTERLSDDAAYHTTEVLRVGNESAVFVVCLVYVNSTVIMRCLGMRQADWNC